MRTKTLLVAVAAISASIATSMAQAVYSQNVVGYVNVSLPANSTAGGFKIIANPLNGTNNTLATIIPNPPVGTKAYLYNNASLVTVAVFGPDDDNNNNWGADASQVVSPGKAFWIQNPGAATSLTFVGEVAQGNLTNAVPSGFSLRASQVPQAGQLDTVLAYPAVVGSTIVYKYVPGSGYTVCTRGLDDDNNPAWDTIPVIDVAEGFWVSETANRNWTRSFTVN